MTTPLDGTDNKQGSTKKTGQRAWKAVFAVALVLPLVAVTTLVVKDDLDRAQSAERSRATFAESAQTGRDIYASAQADKKFMEVLPQMAMETRGESHLESDLSASLDAAPFGWLYRLMPGTRESLKTAREYDALSNDPMNMKVYPTYEAFMQVKDACKLVDEMKQSTPEQDLTVGSRALQEPKNFKAELRYCGADSAVYEPKFDKLRAAQDQQLADSVMFDGTGTDNH